MASKASSNHKKGEPTTHRVRRINWKALWLLAGVLLLGVIVYFPLKYLNNRTVRMSALTQAEQARKKGDVDLALKHLDRYLADKPEDIQVLEAKAKMLSEIPLPWFQLIEAANSLDQLIRLDPLGEGRLETRRKLAEFYIRYSDDLKIYADIGSDPDVERLQSRYAAAASIAKQLLDDATKGKYKDAVAHRLLARASEGQISELRGKASLNSSKKASEKNEKAREREEEDLRLTTVRNYRAAIDVDPHDLESAARLASLYWNWMKDETASDQVLDGVLAANPNSSEARLTRYRAYTASGRTDRARAELAEIIKLVPDNLEIRIEAANIALNNRDPNEARRQLDAIPEAKQNDLRIKVLRGYMEFAEQHPDDAIDQWRRGLLLVGGSNLDLTWKLAFNLIQLGRYVEADPLRVQYNRLAKSDKNGMSRFLDALFDIGYGRLYDAREKLEKIKDLVPAYLKSDVLLSLGRCCDIMGDPDAALISFRNAATASPSSPAPRLAIARHLQKRHPDDAITEVDRALVESPKEPTLLTEAIRLRIIRAANLSFLEANRRRELEDLLDRLQKNDPSNPSIATYHSEILALTGQLRDAVELLRRSTKAEGRRIPEVWINLANALDRVSQRNDALKVLDEAALPENAGDHAKIRIIKARILTSAGRGQAAREVLLKDRENLSIGEQPELAKALGDLLREFGDREGARAAYVEWARLAPRVPGPALALLTMGQVDNDPKASKLGMETLKQVGGEREPYGLAARALDLMRSDPNRPGPPPSERLYEAELLIKTLRHEVPSLRIGSLLEGILLEHRGDLVGALRCYKLSQRDDINSPALPKLIEALMKLKRFDELEGLKREFSDEAKARQQSYLIPEFDRMTTAVALNLGEKDQADYFASKMIEGRKDNVAVRANFARLLDSHNKPEQAEESLRSLVKEKPYDPNAWLTLIAFLSIRKTPEEIAPTINQARRDCKSDRPELFLAQCYWLAKDIPRAEAAFKKAVETKPADVVTLRGLVEYYEGINQPEKVEAVLRKVLSIDSTTGWAARALAMKISGHLDPATWPEAWALVAPGSSTAGDTPEDRLVRATVLARSPESNRRMEAIPAFKALTNDLPISNALGIDTRVRLAQALLEIGRIAEAWDTIRPVADDVSRPNPSALIIAVEALANSKRADEAEVYLKRLTQVDPKSPQVLLSTSWVQMARGQKAEALASLEKAYADSASEPNGEAIGLLAYDRALRFRDLETSLRIAKALAEKSPALSWCLGRVYSLRKEPDQAMAAFQTALAAGSAREAMRYAMSTAISKRSDPAFVAKVVEFGEAARKKDPKDYNIPVFVGTVRHLQERYEEELACYREALELNPSNVQFLNNMAWTLAEGLGKTEEAMKIIQEAIRREGEAPEYLDTRGVIEERLGDLKKAIDDLEKSAKGAPSATTYFHLARVYLKSNDPAASRRCRDQALGLNFDAESLDPTDRSDLEKVMKQR